VEQVTETPSPELAVEESAVASKVGGIPFSLIVALFVASGLSSLIYQVVWTRTLVLVFGSTTFATSTVLGVFMGGLALGSFVAGKYCMRVKNPFLAYGILEGIIGLWALLVPFFFEAAVPLYKMAWQAFHLQALPFSVLRLIMTALILIVPTSCMGATLPLLAKFVTDSLSYVSSRVGSLYAANTWGAVVGAALAGFCLLPALGLQTTTFISAGINFALAAIVILAARKMNSVASVGTVADATTADTATAEVKVAEKHVIPLTTKLVMAAFAISGAVAMTYEVAWTRTLLMVIGSSTYAFSIMLTTFLIGIFLGSLICSRFIDRAKEPIGWFAALQIGLCFAGLLSMYLFNQLPWLNLVVNGHFLNDPNAGLFFRFLLAGRVLLPITLILGAIFPVVVKCCADNLNAVGRTVGTLYSCNTLGAIAGALLAGFVVIPAIGVENALIGSCAVNLLVGIGLLFMAKQIRVPVRIIVAATAIVVASFFIIKPQVWDRVVMLSAQTARRQMLLLPLKMNGFDEWRDALRSVSEAAYWKDGESSTVGVLRFKKDGGLSLVTNGHIDASDKADMSTQILLGAYPCLWRTGVKDVAVIGWGSGVTVGAAEQFPVKSITAIELEPAVIEAGRFFNHVNHKADEDPRVTMEINDGRNYLLATDKKFDVIVSEPSNPWQAGVCNLFTEQYFKICKDRLNSGGVFAQWLQTLEIPTENIRQIISALHNQFPYILPMTTDRGNLVLLASDQPLELNEETFNKAMQNPAIKKEFERCNIKSFNSLLAHVAAMPDSIDGLVAGAPPNIDDTNRLEYAVGKTYETTVFLGENFRLLDENLGKPWDEAKGSWRTPAEKAAAFADVAKEATLLSRIVRARDWAQASLAVAPNPEAYRILGICMNEVGKHQQAYECWRKALELNPNDIQTLQTEGMARLQSGDAIAARPDFERVLKIEPGNKPAMYHLALTYMPPLERGERPRLPDNNSANMIHKFIAAPVGDSEFIKRHPDVSYLSGVADYVLGDYPAATAKLTDFVKLRPGAALANGTLASAARLLHDMSKVTH
jgi:spermidine synthase